MFDNIRRKFAYLVYPEIFKEKDRTREAYLTWSKEARRLDEELRQERMRTEGIDPKNIMRQLIGLVPVNVEVMDDMEHGLTEAQRVQFHTWGYQLSHTEWWQRLRAYSLNKNAAKTLKEMLVNERYAWIGGGTINGIMFVDEMVEGLRAAHENDMAPDEPYDEHKVIPS